MKCPNCFHENDNAAVFCTGCGKPILDQAESGTTDGDTGAPLSQQIESLREEVGKLRKVQAETLGHLQERILLLERLSEASERGSQKQEGIIPANIKQIPQSQTNKDDDTTGGSVLSRVQDWNWEYVLGGNWLARIGILALVVGVAFFLKLAFDNDWVGSWGRVAIGIGIGAALVGGSEYWKKAYPVFAQTLGGGGLAVLYLTLLAANTILGIIGLYTSTVILLLISVTGAAMAMRHDSKGLAIISALGGFAAPFLLSVFAIEPTSGSEPLELSRSDSGIDILVYIFIVNIGVLALATFSTWRWLTVIAWAGSILSFLPWYFEFSSEATLLIEQGSLTIIFLSILLSTVFHHLAWKRDARAFDLTLMTGNAFSYYGISYMILSDHFADGMGAFTFGLSFLYGILAYLFWRNHKEDLVMALFSLGLAIVFFTVAIPVQLDGSSWITVAWAAQGAVGIWLSFRLQFPRIRISAYLAFLLVAIRLMFFDTDIDLDAFTIFINERVLVFSLSIIAIYMSGFWIWKHRDRLTKWETSSLWSVFPLFMGAASIFTLWIIIVEIIWGFDKQIAQLSLEQLNADGENNLLNGKNLSITVALGLYSILLFGAGLLKRWRLARIGGLVLLLMAIIKVFAFDVFALEQAYRIAAFVGLGILLLVGGYVYQRFGAAIRGYIVDS